MSEKLINKCARDEEGSVTAFIVVMFLTMVVASGMAVDFMRHETARADLQNALDRGVLAATNLAQGVSDKEQVVEEYMLSRSFKPAALSLDVDYLDPSDPDYNPNKFTVTAEAAYELPTFFLKLIGFNTMTIPANSSATHIQNDLEVALVLDVSSSMVKDYSRSSGDQIIPKNSTQVTKLELLQEAAVDFVEEILSGDRVEKSLVSLVPYSSNVALPSSLASFYNFDTHHNHSYCVEFDNSDYSDTDITASQSLEQYQHYGESSSHVSELRTKGYIGSSEYVYICPSEENEVTAYSNSVSDLTSAINGMRPERMTATFAGMKWATALLDPESQRIVSTMVSSGELSDSFDGAPVDYNTVGVTKAIVLMTDGGNTDQRRVKWSTYNWVRSNWGSNWFNNNYPNSGWLQDYVWNNKNSWSNGEGDDLMHDICDAAKSAGIVVYTIGFEVTDITASKLSYCATDASKHYLVEGVDISTAFDQIAADVQSLKLTY